jgi:hypothetical protein
MATRIALIAVLASLVGCASAGSPKPDAIFRHPTTGDVQWCDKPSAAMMALGGAIVAASQSTDYADCKTGWEGKGYARLGSSETLPPDAQQRYTDERARIEKATADSIRKN